jgi:hypothetical protein
MLRSIFGKTNAASNALGRGLTARRFVAPGAIYKA